MAEFKPICSPEEMIEAIRTIGMIPFTKCTVPGWSIQEMTHPDFWFMSSDELGPWDWKIDAVQSGIVYGKFLSRKSAFATEEMYRHLMNWRRSLPYYRMVVGEIESEQCQTIAATGKVGLETGQSGLAKGEAKKSLNLDERLQKYISPTLLRAIREHETLEYSDLKNILEREVPLDVRKKIGGYVGRYLIPKVNKQAIDFMMQYLDMGTWTVIGDITRVYRGPNCEYKGWQRNSVTTPELLFDRSDCATEKLIISKVLSDAKSDQNANAPFWAKFIDDSEPEPTPEPEAIRIDCTPEESKEYLLSSLSAHFPGSEKALEKLIKG